MSTIPTCLEVTYNLRRSDGNPCSLPTGSHESRRFCQLLEISVACEMLYRMGAYCRISIGFKPLPS